MTQVYEILGLGTVTCWCLFQMLAMFCETRRAVLISVICSALYLIVLYKTEFVTLPIAIFAPFGAMLPALAAQNMLRRTGADLVKFSTVEIVFLLSVYVLYLAASLGVFEFDPYRLGYSPVAGGIVAVAGILYFYLRKHWLPLYAIILGQLAWSFDIGSSNFFDHISHAVLVPSMGVILVTRCVSLLLRTLK